MFHVCSTCVTAFVSFVFTVCWMTLNMSLFRFYCIWHCLLTRHWFAQCPQHLYIGIILQYYIILDKGCHIFFAFCLNSMVCICLVTRSLITLWWMLTCIIVFYCVCISKVSSNLQCVLVFDAIFYFSLVCLLSLILLVFYYIWYCHFYLPVAFASYCSIHMSYCV